jgi:ubiquinone/menaquinone biosynthesis C-methylase UbiE
VARVDYDKQSAVYDRGRTMPPEGLAVWMAVARKHIGDATHRILDLGSGTGRFSAALVEVFDAEVIGVEPSAGMRGRAATKPRDRIRLVGGAAEYLPLTDEAIDAAWLSNVIHHFDDLDAAAAELRRVLINGGPVLIRGAFAGREYSFTLYDFFPETETHLQSFPSLDGTIDTFERAGFTSFSIEAVEQITWRTFAEAYEATKLRADSLLEALSDDAFEQGLEKLARAAATNEGPVTDSLDLFVAR